MYSLSPSTLQAFCYNGVLEMKKNILQHHERITVSNEKAKKSNAVIYIEAMGCFIFLIALVVGFFFLAMKTYEIYSSNSARDEPDNDIRKQNHSKVSTEKQTEQQGNDKIFKIFVNYVKNAQSEEQVHNIVDKFSRLPLNRYDRERMDKFAELRIEELRK